MDCLYRAYISACAAVGADFRIDLIDITLRNSFHRAFIDTSSASCAICINYIGHSTYF